MLVQTCSGTEFGQMDWSADQLTQVFVLSKLYAAL